jgi:hypothetical protein
MTTQPTRTATPPASPSRVPRRSARTARRVALAGATLVLAGAGVAVAAPASAETVTFEHLFATNACKSPGKSGPMPNTYYVTVTLLGNKASAASFTFESLSVKSGAAMTSITPKEVTIPAGTGDRSVTLTVEGGATSANGAGTLTATYISGIYRDVDVVPVPTGFAPTKGSNCAVPAPAALSVP